MFCFVSDINLLLVSQKGKIMEKNNETLHILRHSSSHIMAQAVQKLFPTAKLAIGPAVDNGFYYDFDLEGHAFTEEDLQKIEEEMKAILKQNLTFEKYQIPAKRIEA